MRIVAGTARGRRLVVPEGVDVRPTSDRAREATFNALDSIGATRDAVVLDLFAGTGALGLEALSRGAAHVTFVDRSAAAIDAVRANVDALGFGERATVVRADAMDRVSRSTDVYDLALLDPPYTFDAWPELLERVRAEVVMVESDQQIDVMPHWVAFRQKRYAGTVVVLARAASVAGSEES